MAPPTQRDLDRELARARGARRLLPWALASALAAGALGWTAGGGVRGAASLFLVGLVFSLYLWATSIARCPACGARVGGRARPAVCPGCGVRF